MAHPLVEQLRFTRSEWRRALRGVTEADGVRRLEPMNSIGWIVGHLAWQEQRYFLTRALGEKPIPALDLVANGAPASTPPLADMLAAWKAVTSAADAWLDRATTVVLERPLGPTTSQRGGDAIQRVTYHYWFHIGEILAIRQLLEGGRLPEFVGDIDGRAPYRPPDD